MPYKINPFTGNPDFYEASSGGTVTSITAGTGLNGGTITTSGTIDLDITKVPYYSGGPLVSGFTKWNGTTWVIDTNSYVNKAGDTMTGHLTLSADPTLALQAATKQYVDNLAGGGINFHEPTYGASTANLSATYNNGVSGLGATLTATANGELILDGINYATLPIPSSPYRVLIKDQSNQIENGIYVVTDPGSPLTQYILTRATDADNSPSGELAYGDFSLNINGSAFGGYGFIMNATSPITIGTDNITYVAYNIAQGVIAGTGITESPANTINIDLTKVPYYSSFSIGLAKWDGASWVFDNTTYLDTTTAASTYLTQANAASTYYLQTNPAGYITTAALSGYVPYTGATNNVDLGAFQLTTSQLNISTVGGLSTTAGILKLEAAASTNLVLNTPNVSGGSSTKVQFGGADSLILIGPSTTGNITNFTYNKPTRSGLTGGTNINGIKIDTGISEWIDYSNLPLIQKEIEILGPTYNMTSGPIPTPGSEEFYTLYINPPTVQPWGVFGNALGIYGSFQMKGDATDYPLGTVLDIGGDGLGTMIGFTGAKLSFFGNPPIVKPAAVTTVQGLSDALSNLGLIAPSTIVGYVPYTGANANVDLGTYNLTTPTIYGSTLSGGSLNLSSTSNVTKGFVNIVNDGGKVNIGNASNTSQLLLRLGEASSFMDMGGVGSESIISMNQNTNPGVINYTIRASSTTTFYNAPTLLRLQIATADLVQIRGLTTSGATTNFTFTKPNNTSQTANTPIVGVNWNLGSRQWATGDITSSAQKEFELTSPTYSFVGASTITNAYSLYVNAPTADTNATITNNYALGIKGQLGFEWTNPAGATMKIGDWSGAFLTYGWGISTSNNLFRLPPLIYYGDSNFVIQKSGTQDGIIQPYNNLTLQSINATGGQKIYLYGQQSTGHVGIGTILPTERLTISGGNLLLEDGGNLVVGSTNGTKIGTATTQKLGFFNATPIVQPSAVTTVQQLATALGNLGLIAASTVPVYYETVEDEGVAVTQRTNINFTGAGVSVADSGGKTVVTISGPSWEVPDINISSFPLASAAYVQNSNGAGLRRTFLGNANDIIYGTIPLDNKGLSYDASNIKLKISWQMFNTVPGGADTVIWQVTYAYILLGESGNAKTATTVNNTIVVGARTPNQLYEDELNIMTGLANAKILEISISRLGGAGGDTYGGDVFLFGVRLTK